MTIEVRIDKIRRAARTKAVELTILEDGQEAFTERLSFPAGLSKAEVRDRIGRLALARTSEGGRAEPDWDLPPGRKLRARDMLKPKEAPGHGQALPPVQGGG